VRLLNRGQGIAATAIPDVTEPFALEAEPLLQGLERLLSPQFFKVDRVRVGVPSSVAYFFLPLIIKHLGKDWPVAQIRGKGLVADGQTPVELEIVPENSKYRERVFQMLKNRLLDAVIESSLPTWYDDAAQDFAKPIPLIKDAKLGLIFLRDTYPTLDSLERHRHPFDFNSLKEQLVILPREEGGPALYQTLCALLPASCQRLTLTAFSEIRNLVQLGRGIGLGYRSPTLSGQSLIGFIDLEAYAHEQLKHLKAKKDGGEDRSLPGQDSRPPHKLMRSLNTLLGKLGSSLNLYLRSDWEETFDKGGLSEPAKKVKDAIIQAGIDFAIERGAA
jgi:DNA-binding transcriptional LysR family regulator